MSVGNVEEWAKGKRGPIVLVGDFNDLPGSTVYSTLTGHGSPFADSWRVAGRAEDGQSYTHHGFTGIPRDGRIDWILATPDFEVLDVAIVHDRQAERYPSDHFPYWADLDLDERAGTNSP